MRSKLTLHFGLPEYEVSCAHDGGSYRESKHSLYTPAQGGQLDPASTKPCWETAFNYDAYSYFHAVVLYTFLAINLKCISIVILGLMTLISQLKYDLLPQLVHLVTFYQMSDINILPCWIWDIFVFLYIFMSIV